MAKSSRKPKGGGYTPPKAKSSADEAQPEIHPPDCDCFKCKIRTIGFSKSPLQVPFRPPVLIRRPHLRPEQAE